MKNFKISTVATIYVILAVILSVGCADEKSTSITDNSENRIKLKEVRVINGRTYSIIEVDSVEYLTQGDGGFARITK